VSLTAPFLRSTIRHVAGALTLDVSLELRQPWTVLFGPSGSGKTTILRAIAGLIRPQNGEITLALPDQTTLFNSSTGVDVPAHLRPVRSAQQTPRLFPHLSVRENLLYGCGPGATPREQQALAGNLLRLFRIEPLAEARPHRLSGGEQQRANVARAVLSAVSSGRSLLLLDEPFTGLDAEVASALLRDLQRWPALSHTPVLSVTHNLAEAFQLGAEVIKLRDGTVTSQGPAEVVLAEERLRLLEDLGA
jgi:molybdate transport system ATP-binding protein